jgi:hypothetical protein
VLAITERTVTLAGGRAAAQRTAMHPAPALTPHGWRLAG